MIDVEFNTTFLLVQRYTSSNTIIESIILHGISQYSHLYRVATDFRMHDNYILYDDGEWTVVAYLLSRIKCGEATLPERL